MKKKYPTPEGCVTVEEINDMFNSYQEELDRTNLHLKEVVQFTADDRLDEALKSVLFSAENFLQKS